MNTREDFLKQKPTFTLLNCANYGEGKTSLAITFPKFFYLGFRQGGLEVLKQPKNKKYQQNLVAYDDLCPTSDKELKEMYCPHGATNKIRETINIAKGMAKNGEVETLILDDFTDCVENLAKYIWTFEEKRTDRGLVDNQTMYGMLKRYVSNMFDYDILTFRKYGNLIVNVHLMRESEQTVEGTPTRAGAVDKKSDIYPDIVGSFRREVQRKFENVIYFESRFSGGKKQYVAYCNKISAMGTTLLAKNAIGLPDVVENVSYDTLVQYLKQKEA